MDVLSTSFHHDPVYTYIMHDLADAERAVYLPKLIQSVVRSSILNGGEVCEADDWSACGVAMPPGRRADSVGSLLQAGLLPVLWNLGISGCKVSSTNPRFTTATNTSRVVVSYELAETHLRVPQSHRSRTIDSLREGR